MDETPYRLAYEASVRAVQDQTAVLEGLRSRAGTVFAATALVTSFLGGQALDGHRLGLWSWVGVAAAAFVVSALLTLAILWPFDFGFSLGAADLLAIVDERASTAPLIGADAYRELAIRLEINYDANAGIVKMLFLLLRLAIVSLAVEVAAWNVALERV